LKFKGHCPFFIFVTCNSDFVNHQEFFEPLQSHNFAASLQEKPS